MVPASFAIVGGLLCAPRPWRILTVVVPPDERGGVVVLGEHGFAVVRGVFTEGGLVLNKSVAAPGRRAVIDVGVADNSLGLRKPVVAEDTVVLRSSVVASPGALFEERFFVVLGLLTPYFLAAVLALP